MKALIIFLIGVAIFIIWISTAEFKYSANDNRQDVKIYLYTRNHDGHKFIFHSMFGRPGGLIHHPDCDCLTNEAKK